MEKENLKQNRHDDRRDIGRKNEIFKNGIKGTKKITEKYNTSKLMTEVKISCPCGLKWTWKGGVSSPIRTGETDNSLDQKMYHQTSNPLDKSVSAGGGNQVGGPG